MADTICAYTEVAFDFRVHLSDLPDGIDTAEELADLTEEEWETAFQNARSRQHRFKCKKASPLRHDVLGERFDYVVMELGDDDGVSPGSIYGWMDVSDADSMEDGLMGVMLGHPAGCPQTLTTGITEESFADEERVIFAYNTSGFSGGPIFLPETGRVETVDSTGYGADAHYAACIDDGADDCQPTSGGESCGNATWSFVDYQGTGVDRGFCAVFSNRQAEISERVPISTRSTI